MITESWQPYADDHPLFVPELFTGPGALLPDDRDRLATFLEALVRRRGAVHIAAAFNAIYFGYDLGFGGYVGGPLDFDKFPEVRFGDTTNALPVGAMVRIATGGSPLFAEVVYKEGSHPQLDTDGDVPSWLSGAPAGAAGPGQPQTHEGPPALHERLVVDFDAFGKETIVAPKQLDRIRHRGRWLNEAGHLTMNARYPDAATAEATDREFFARYLLTAGRDLLLAGPLPLMFDGGADDKDRLGGAVHAALNTLATVLREIPGLRMWRDYAFTRESFARRLSDKGPLGGGDLSMLADEVSHVAVHRSRFFPAPTARTRYTAVGPRLREIHGSKPRLTGISYPLAVCHANSVIADFARRDCDDAGVLSSGAHLRLDDGWQGGGVWRASVPPGPYTRISPIVPYGLGWLDSLPIPHDQGDDELPDRDVERADMLSVGDSQISWTSTLRLSHQLDGTSSPLPERAAEEITASGLLTSQIRLEITHAGQRLDREEETQEVSVCSGHGKTRLAGVAWPLDLFPGIVLTFTWQRGSRVVQAHSSLLEPPVTIDGIEYGHHYDLAVLTRDAAPGCPRRGDTAARGALSLRDRVLRAIRRVGKLAADGSAVLPADRLGALVYGSGAGSGADVSLEPVVDELVASGTIEIKDGNLLVWRPAVVAQVPRQPDAADRGPGTGLALKPARRSVAEYFVPAFLRRLPQGQQAGEDQRAEYRRLTAQFGPSVDLPRGFTLVRGHKRGKA